jgi:hypothetical protein
MNRLKLLVIWLFCMLGGFVSSLWMLFAILFGSDRAWRIAIGFDQVVNAAFGGEEDETISSRCWRYRDEIPYKILVFGINFLFKDPDHCRNSFLNEQARRAKVRHE